MTDQYETSTKAELFSIYRSEQKELREKLIEPMVRQLVSESLRRKCRRIVDLACGTGVSTRLLADLMSDNNNNAELIGVDLSAEMISRANDESKQSHSHICFLVKDCTNLLELGQFDLVFSHSLLHYFDNRSDLQRVYDSMSEATMSDGGVCAAVMMNPFLTRDRMNAVYSHEPRYGFTMKCGQDETTVDVKFYANKQLAFEIKCWNWNAQIHEECARQAGFKQIEWLQQQVDPQLVQSKPEYWQDLIKHSPYAYLKLTK